MNYPIKKIIVLTVLAVSLLLNIFGCVFTVTQIRGFEEKAARQMQADKIEAFENAFLQDVVLSSQPIDFNTRLALENEVRSLNDADILAKWETFTNSQTQDSASAAAKDLLQLLIQKTGTLAQ